MKTLFNKLKQSEIFYGILVSLMVFPMGLLIIACADTAISWRYTKENIAKGDIDKKYHYTILFENNKWREFR